MGPEPSAQSTQPGQAPIWVVSFDGGGVRGYSSLIILAEIIKRSGRENDRIFAAILGTSAGGLNALMIGRLGLRLGDWDTEFRKLSTRVFRTRVWNRYIAWWFGQVYSADEMADGIKDIIRRSLNTQNVDQGMQSPIPSPIPSPIQSPIQTPTYVVCREVDTNGNLKPGHVAIGTRNNHGPNSTIWEAGRATSAAPTYFKCQRIGERAFIDGGLGYNNPIGTIDDELTALGCPKEDKNRIHYISIGTGKPNQLQHEEARRSWWRGSFGRTFKRILPHLKFKLWGEHLYKFFADEKARQAIFELDLAESAHVMFEMQLGINQGDPLNTNQRYFRFNCIGEYNSYSLADTKLDQFQHLDRIKSATNAYLEDIRGQIDGCARLLRQRNETFFT